MTIPIQKKAVVQTKRLTLKPYAPEDLSGLIELLTDPRITKTFMVPEYETAKQYEELARKLIGFSRLEDTKHLEYGIYLRDKLIGFLNDCGYEDREIEIGYVIHPEYQGQGYAAEAVTAILDELRQMGFRKVRAGYFEDNPASRRVMEKCGMRQTDETDEEEYRGARHVCRYCEICF